MLSRMTWPVTGTPLFISALRRIHVPYEGVTAWPGRRAAEVGDRPGSERYRAGSAGTVVRQVGAVSDRGSEAEGKVIGVCSQVRKDSTPSMRRHHQEQVPAETPELLPVLVPVFSRTGSPRRWGRP